MLSLQRLVNFQVETLLCGILNSASADPHHLRDNMHQFNQYLNTFCSEQSSFQRMCFQFYTCCLETILYPEEGTSFTETLFLANWKTVLKLERSKPIPSTPTIQSITGDCLLCILLGFIRRITSENCIPFNLICIPEFTHWFFQMSDI